MIRYDRLLGVEVMATVTRSKEQQDAAVQRKLTKPVSLGQAMDRFLRRADSKYKVAPYEQYTFAMMALREYVNSFGNVLLRAQGITPSIEARSNGEIGACDIYEPAAVVPFLRGFRIFFLEHKVNALEEVKAEWRSIVAEFIGWLVERNHLGSEQLLDYILSPPGDLIAAALAQKVLANA